jgi:hypothetical protein
MSASLIKLIQPKDLPNFLRCKLKAYTIENLPKAVSRALVGSYIGCMDWKHVNSKGDILAADINYNSLTDQGEQDILEAFYVNQNAPAGDIYLGLANSTPTDTSTLATITEVTGTSYARQQIVRSTAGWPTRGLVSGDWQIESTQETFTAGGTWTQANYGFLASVVSGTSGRFWNYLALTTPRVLTNGDSLNVIYKIKLQ